MFSTMCNRMLSKKIGVRDLTPNCTIMVIPMKALRSSYTSGALAPKFGWSSNG